jgi:hypothetical protein
LIDDPYVDPATGVLINLLGSTDAAALARSEAQYVALGLHEVDQRPQPDAYDVAHLQAFHRHLFGDVYPWAGDVRTLNIARTVSFGDWRTSARTSTRPLLTSHGRTTSSASTERSSFVGWPTTSGRSTRPTRSGRATAGRSGRSSANSPAMRPGTSGGRG